MNEIHCIVSYGVSYMLTPGDLMRHNLPKRSNFFSSSLPGTFAEEDGGLTFCATTHPSILRYIF